MGCGSSVTVTPESKAIEKELKEQQQRLKRELKLILLGTGAVGKSTIAKQLKVIHMNGYTDVELKLYAEFVHQNIFFGFKSLVRAMDELKREPQSDFSSLCDSIREMTVVHGNLKMTPELGEQLAALWSDPVVKSVWDDSPTARQEGSASYFFDNLQRCCANNYMPTLDDVLHVRTKTTGIKEIAFAYKGFTFRVVDVGGQRSERRKWIHCFQDVTTVLYVASLADYDLMMEEDPTCNRLLDSLDLFNKVINNPFFIKIDIMLFLNKKDLFEEKLKRTPVSVCFKQWPTGKDPQSYKDTVDYISARFQESDQGRAGGRKVYVYETCATDTKSVQAVWKAVHDILLRGQLQEIGGTSDGGDGLPI